MRDCLSLLLLFVYFLVLPSLLTSSISIVVFVLVYNTCIDHLDVDYMEFLCDHVHYCEFIPFMNGTRYLVAE